MKKITNAKTLRENLLNELDIFYKSKKESTDLDRLNSISKTSSTVIRSAKIELEYAKYKDTNVEIPFLK